jgi:hypothetical protein
VVLFWKSLLDWSLGSHPNTIEKRSNEDLRTQVVLANLHTVAVEA